MEEKDKEFGNSLLALVRVLIYIGLVLYNVMIAMVATQATPFIIILLVALTTSYGLWYILSKRIPEIYNRGEGSLAYIATVVSVVLFAFVNMGLCAGLGSIAGI